jgi:hypothetical protein
VPHAETLDSDKLAAQLGGLTCRSLTTRSSRETTRCGHNTPPGVEFSDHSTIGCTPEAERTLDRRLVLAAVVGMAALQAR